MLVQGRRLEMVTLIPRLPFSLNMCAILVSKTCSTQVTCGLHGLVTWRPGVTGSTGKVRESALIGKRGFFIAVSGDI